MLDHEKDIQEILSHRYDDGAEFWTMKAPFSMIESISYLLDLGISAKNEVLEDCAVFILSCQKEDGRIKLQISTSYPCHTAIALNTLCKLGYSDNKRLEKTFQYFLDTQEEDGGWKCNKYSFGRGPETNYSTPHTTLVALDAFRYTDLLNNNEQLDKAVEFLLKHWEIKKPISPCHYGIGKLFMQVQYPFRDSYNIFNYLYVLSFYDVAKKDKRFNEMLDILKSKTVDNQIIVERVVPKLAKLTFCKKGEPSVFATKKYEELLDNLK